MAKTNDPSALTEEEKRQIIAFLQERAPNHKCASCGQEQFFLADHLVTPVVATLSGGINLGGTNYPMAMGVCTNCHHVHFFAVVPMGIKKDAPREKKEQEKQEEAPSDG